MPITTRQSSAKLAAITVRRLPIAAVQRLKGKAKAPQHSLEAEVGVRY